MPTAVFWYTKSIYALHINILPPQIIKLEILEMQGSNTKIKLAGYLCEVKKLERNNLSTSHQKKRSHFLFSYYISFTTQCTS